MPDSHDDGTVMSYSTVCTSLKLHIQKVSSIFFTTRAYPKSAPANASRLIANDADDLAINDQIRRQAPYNHYHINGRTLTLDLHRAQPISIEARSPNDI